MAQANALAQLLPPNVDFVLWVREVGLDPDVLAEYADALDGACPGRWDVLELEGGEALKRWDAMPHLFDTFQAYGLTRSSLMLTCGGGALSDAVGLAAALWKRGLRVAHIPTTTLAMVDAAWGGKTGINWRGAKNQLGTFTLPEFVHLDARWLVTLPDRERRAGLAEVAKHAMLHAHLGQAHLEDWPAWDTTSEALEAWTAKLEKSAQSKMTVVDADLHERGARAQLNLGHTVGHAIEAHFAATAQSWLHGEAVALGLRFVLFQAKDAAPEACQFLDRWIATHVPLPDTPLAQWPDAEALWSHMTHDKKNVADKVVDVAWHGWGKVEWPVMLEKSTFEATWARFVRSLEEAGQN